MRRLIAPAFLLIALASCRGAFHGGASRTTPVILISIDTLRSDHLPAYGYGGVATPAIDALRADSILFERAYSHVPLTLPSHTSIFTGELPADHGIRDNIGFHLSEKIPTLASVLKANGYATGGAVSAFVLRRESGIARGFDFYDDQVEPIGPSKVMGRVQRDGRETLHSAEAWLDQQNGKPFFLFLHLYEPHTPYTPPEPYFSRYQQHYDGEIAYADSIVGELIDRLKATGVYDKALIVLLSDHGEGLSEHGEEEHGIFLYREALQVPLILKLPHAKRAGASVATPVQLVDVFPTITELTASSVPAAGHRPGTSLLALLDGSTDRPIYSETYYPRFHFGWSDLHSLIRGNDHFIRAPQAELYDLRADPGEKKNTLESNRRAYVRMRAEIEPFVKTAAAPTNVDPEEAAKLAALGYVGSTVDTHAGDNLPDPKTTIAVFEQIRQAYTWFRDGKEQEALDLTNRLLAGNGQITDLWDLKYNIYNKMNRPKDAVEAAKEGLRHVPTSISLLFDVANGALEMNDFDTAEQHADIALKIEPGRAHEVLAHVAIGRHDEKRAEAEAKASAAASSDPTNALMILANLARKRSDYTTALAYIDRVAERVRQKRPPRMAELHLTRGDVLARLGRASEAEQEFRSEIDTFPKEVKAYSSLILLLASEQRNDEATKVVYDAIKAVPGPHGYAVVSDTLKAIGDDNGAKYWAYEGLKKYPDDAELRALPSRFALRGSVQRGMP
jgi:tetratricopeptide (TPR) repeat protein